MAVIDAVHAVAHAVDTIIKECLGDPKDQTLLARTLKEIVSEGGMRVGNDTIPVRFDKKGRRFAILKETQHTLLRLCDLSREEREHFSFCPLGSCRWRWAI